MRSTVGPFHILIADDSEHDAAFILQGFEDIQVSVEVTHARDGDACMELLSRPNSFRLALLDFYLPRKTAPEIIELLKQDGKDTAGIVVLTSFIPEEQRGRLMDAGVRHILEKPVGLEGFGKLAAHLVTLMQSEPR